MQKNILSQKRIDLIFLIATGVAVFFVASYFDILESLFEFTKEHEEWELDELIIVAIYGIFAFSFYSYRRWKELSRITSLLEKTNEELQASLADIKQLKEIIPICASCRKIRDDEGYWHRLESYLSQETNTVMSHGICPECVEKEYPEYVK